MSALSNDIIKLILPPLLHPVSGLFSRTTWVSRYQKGKTSLDLNEARDDGVFRCSGFSWTICKQSAPHSTQITTSTPHHSIFAGRMLFLAPSQQCQSTEGIVLKLIVVLYFVAVDSAGSGRGFRTLRTRTTALCVCVVGALDDGWDLPVVCVRESVSSSVDRASRLRPNSA